MIGICINYQHDNYGGMLQAYSTVCMLKNLGAEYEIIRYEKEWNIFSIICSIPRLFNYVLLNDKYELLLKKHGLKKHPEIALSNEIRKESFKKFRESHFNSFSPVCKGYKKLCQNALRYEMVMVGSDQLWSPAGLPTNFYNLMFVPDNIKKVSFASSFGVANIPWYQKKRTTKFLVRIDEISMRENRGAEIVKQLTGRDVPVIMDPVFYFDKNDWTNIIPDRRENLGEYIFCYFLGDNQTFRDVIDRFAKKSGLKIITLRHLDRFVKNDENFGDYAPYDVDPERFLNILRNAKYVFTDSYHGTVFSVINEKNFVVFDRYDNSSRISKNSRIDSLCLNLGLEDRRWSKDNDISEILFKPIDYLSVNQKLQEYRKTTYEFLSRIFKN